MDTLPENILYVAYKIKPQARDNLRFDWEKRVLFVPGAFPTSRCDECYLKMLDELQSQRDYVNKNSRLRAFDPFAGVGAFANGLAEAANLELTQAIEIDQDAAMTLKSV